MPTALDLDVMAGYPKDNEVYPNKSGYARLGTSIYELVEMEDDVRLSSVYKLI